MKAPREQRASGRNVNRDRPNPSVSLPLPASSPALTPEGLPPSLPTLLLLPLAPKTLSPLFSLPFLLAPCCEPTTAGERRRGPERARARFAIFYIRENSAYLAPPTRSSASSLRRWSRDAKTRLRQCASRGIQFSRGLIVFFASSGSRRCCRRCEHLVVYDISD